MVAMEKVAPMDRKGLLKGGFQVAPVDRKRFSILEASWGFKVAPMDRN